MNSIQSTTELNTAILQQRNNKERSHSASEHCGDNNLDDSVPNILEPLVIIDTKIRNGRHEVESCCGGAPWRSSSSSGASSSSSSTSRESSNSPSTSRASSSAPSTSRASSSAPSTSRATSSAPSTSMGVSHNAHHLLAGRHPPKKTRKPRAPRGKKAESSTDGDRTETFRAPRTRRSSQAVNDADAERAARLAAFEEYENLRLGQLPQLSQRERNTIAARRSRAKAREREEAERRDLEALLVQNVNHKRKVSSMMAYGNLLRNHLGQPPVDWIELYSEFRNSLSLDGAMEILGRASNEELMESLDALENDLQERGQ